MTRCALAFFIFLALRTGANALTSVPEHCFLNICSDPVGLIAGPEGSAEHHTVQPHGFFCIGVLWFADVKFSSGQVRHYDHLSLVRLFPSLSHANQGYWLIRPDGLHHVSRSAFIHAEHQFGHTKT